MTRVLVYCGICGQEMGIDLEVAKGVSVDEIRSAIAAQLDHKNVRCPRCRSDLVLESASLTTEDPPRLELARKAEQMREGFRGVRFAVGSRDGPRGAVWRIWTNRNDVYVAARAMASEMKVSLDGSGKWRAAFTEAHVARENALISRDRDRAIDKWPRPAEFAAGWTRAFIIIVPASEVLESEVKLPKPDEVIWIDPLPDGWATHFNVLIAAPDATGSEGRGFATASGREHHTEVVTAIDLESGERVWVLAHAEQIDEEWARTIESSRETVLTDAATQLTKAREDPEPHDLRAFLAGHSDDETRFFLELTLPPAKATG